MRSVSMNPSDASLVGGFERNDVLLGRTSVAQRHAGNMFFRKLIRENRVRYQDACVRDEKGCIVWEILRAIQATGGRFLVRNAANDWEQIDDDKAYDKISHALRSARVPKSKARGMKKRIEHVLAKSAPFSTPSTEDLSDDEVYRGLLERQTKLLETFKAACKDRKDEESHADCRRSSWCSDSFEPIQALGFDASLCEV